MEQSKRGMKFWSFMFCALLILAGILFVLLGGLRYWQLERDLKTADTDLRFTSIELPFSNAADVKNSLPFMGSAIIDANGDGVDDLFLGGGTGQDDVVLTFADGSFKTFATIPQEADDATMGAVSIDANKDGRSELFLARESGIWVASFEANGSVDLSRMSFQLNENSVPLSIAVADLNNDGVPDFYISGYIKNELVEGQTIFKRPYGGYSLFLMSDGLNGWVDATAQAGLDTQHNRFTAMFADFENDGDMDLVIAQDTGVVELHKNVGAPNWFEPISLKQDYAYPMGIAAGDYNGDEFIDFYFSNVGHTLPSVILRGDLEKEDKLNTDWILLTNQGDGTFEDTAAEAGLAKLGFGWGTAFADMDLDGKLDVLGAQNYARFPGKELLLKYPSKLMLQQADGTFARAEKQTGAQNKAYGITPLVGDFNGDGKPDIAWANLVGPSRVALSESGTGNFITIRLPDTLETLGTKIVLTPEGRDPQTRWRLSSEGLGSDGSATLFFGLADATKADIEISWPDGTTENVQNVAAGTILALTQE